MRRGRPGVLRLAFGLLLANCEQVSVAGGVYGNTGYESVGVRGGCHSIWIGGGLMIKKDPTTTYGRHGIQTSFPTGYDTEGVIVDGVLCRGRGTKIINHSCSNITFRNCNIAMAADSGGVAINVLEAATNTRIEGNQLYRGDDYDGAGMGGIQIRGASGSTPDKIYVIGNTVDLVTLHAMDVEDGTNIVIRDNILKSSSRSAIEVSQGTETTIENITIRDNHLEQSADGNGSAVLNLEDCTGALIENNKFVPYTGHECISLDDGDEIIIRRNDFSDGDTVSPFAIANSPRYLVDENIDYDTRLYSSADILSGQTSATVTHGLARTPSRAELIITFLDQPTNISHFWVSAATPTTFTVDVDTAVAANTTFAWRSIPAMR